MVKDIKGLLLAVIMIFGIPVFAVQNFTIKTVPFISPRNSAEMNASILKKFEKNTTQTTNFSSGFTAATLASVLAYAHLDPYVVKINNKNYIIVIDSKDNNWSVENILGSNDSKHDLFASLRALESDGDTSKISTKELKKANIRFVLLNKKGVLEVNKKSMDFDINKIAYIDMQNLRYALGNKNDDGTFGYFYLMVKEDGAVKPVAGKVTFEEQGELKKLLGIE